MSDRPTMESCGKLMFSLFTLSIFTDIPVLRSCQELYTAGYVVDAEYMIDPDGPGKGLPAIPVYCDMTTEYFPGTTLVYHDQMFHGVVPRGFEDAGEFRVPITYEGSASIAQLSNLADISGHCSQYLRLDCHHTKIWKPNVPWGKGYWVSRDGIPMPNWGTPTGTRGCKCSLDHSCNMRHQACNCDTNDNVWRTDDGDVTDKATLPVTQLRLGDTGSPNERSTYKVGPLKCWGIEQAIFASCDEATAAGYTGEGDYLIQPPGERPQVQRCNELFLTYPPPVLRSCEELRLAGYTLNGDYLIDPDYSGTGVAPFVVYCNMTSGTTILSHDRQGPLLSKGFESSGEHHIIVHYKGVSLQQAIALVDGSQYCEQYISVQCHGSFVWWRGNVGKWWLSRNGTKMVNWGTPTGVKGCFCSLTQNCDGGRSDLCNCDSNDDIWREDAGILNDKDTLPVSQLRLGDTDINVGTDIPDEAALYSLGELKCSGTEGDIYTSCAALQENGISGEGQYLIDADGEGVHDPSVVVCEGVEEITTKIVNCPNATRIVPHFVTVISGGEQPMVTKSPSLSGSGGSQCPKSCINTNNKLQGTSNKDTARYGRQTSGQAVSSGALNFIIFGVILMLVIVTILLVVAVMQWKRVKKIQLFAYKSPEAVVEQTTRESTDPLSDIPFYDNRAQTSKKNEYQQTPLI